jgi:hypothetical protein
LQTAAIFKTAGYNCLPLTYNFPCQSPQACWLDKSGDSSTAWCSSCLSFNTIHFLLTFCRLSTRRAAALRHFARRLDSPCNFAFVLSWRLSSSVKARLQSQYGRAGHLRQNKSPRHPVQRARIIDRKVSTTMTSFCSQRPISSCWVS